MGWYFIIFFLLLDAVGCLAAFLFMFLADRFGEARVFRWICGGLGLMALLIQEGCGSIVARESGNFLYPWMQLILLMSIILNGLILSTSFRLSIIDGYKHIHSAGDNAYRAFRSMRQHSQAMVEERKNDTRPRCVACDKLIEPSTKICPNCGWTQPENH
jgi:hypothetical protein